MFSNKASHILSKETNSLEEFKIEIKLFIAMKGAHDLPAFSLLALASSIANASDPIWPSPGLLYVAIKDPSRMLVINATLSLSFMFELLV